LYIFPAESSPRLYELCVPKLAGSVGEETQGSWGKEGITGNYLLTCENPCSEFERLREQWTPGLPGIPADRERGGGPYIEGTSLPICEILKRLYVHGSISAIVEYYADVTEQQIKEVIWYARALIETMAAVTENPASEMTDPACSGGPETAGNI
jgi:uncharacterized protein (DUF433 family)